jgi:hypothetical protein
MSFVWVITFGNAGKSPPLPGTQEKKPRKEILMSLQAINQAAHT